MPLKASLHPNRPYIIIYTSNDRGLATIAAFFIKIAILFLSLAY